MRQQWSGTFLRFNFTPASRALLSRRTLSMIASLCFKILDILCILEDQEIEKSMRSRKSP